LNATRSEPHPFAQRSALANAVWILFLLVTAVVLGLLWRTSRSTTAGLNPQAEPRPVVARGDRSAEEQANIQIYERVSPSVVQVTSMSEESGFYGLNDQEVPKGVGSGFVWDTDGHIVTNYHVVEGADGAQVTLADHSTYDAQSVWADPDQDIAVVWIKAPKSKLHPIMVGTSHDLKVGQIVYALGDPFGLDLTMTTGIVSALGREIESANGRQIHGVIQTSAAINPGNSGGPLLDSAGRLIGMNTAIISPSGAFAGIGFAIPVDEVNQYVPELIRHGKVVRPRLGVQVAEDQLTRQMGVEKGALILKVLPDSAAATAHLQGTRRGDNGQIHLGDVILSIDGTPINTAKDLNAALQKYHVGDTVKLTILRDGQHQDVSVTLRGSQ
jgi:S1-C subfamily serine protease